MPPGLTKAAPPRQSDEAAVPASWHTGDVILDLYEVKHVHAAGGMGLVYRVHHRGWNEDLAVKSPRPEAFRRPVDQDNFEREASTWIELGLHPHTVACYYVRRLGGIPRVFAEYVEGGSLQEWVRDGQLYAGGHEAALARMLDVLIQFAWGLGYAHERELVHQDVKPANVLMTPEGIAKVTDFGLAKAQGLLEDSKRRNASGDIFVSTSGMTPAYCSPEQAQRHPLTSKTDIWSWGVSALEMLQGEVTWSAGQAANEALQYFRESGPTRPEVPPTPAALADLLARCLQVDPADRPSGMAEIANALAEIYETTLSRPYPRTAPQIAEALADTLSNRAVSLLDLNRGGEALALWQQALAAEPQHLGATFNLALSEWRTGQLTDEAIYRRLREAERAQSGEWQAHYLLARVYLEKGECMEAIEALGRIEDSSDADRPEVKGALAQAKGRLSGVKEPRQSLAGQSGPVHGVCLSRDTRFILSGGEDGMLRLWQTATGRCVRVMKGHDKSVQAVAWSGLGQTVLSASLDGTVRSWDVAKGTCLRTMEGDGGAVRCVSIDATSQTAISGSDDKVALLWDVKTGECRARLEGHEGPIRCVYLSADGRLALTGSEDKTLRLWDTATGNCQRKLPAGSAWIAAAALSPDATRILSGGGDLLMRLWDAASGHCLRVIEGHAGIVLALAFSRDGRFALSGCGDGIVRWWDLATGRCLLTGEGHDGWVEAVSLSADDRLAITSGRDGSIKLWELGWDSKAPWFISRITSSESALAAGSAYAEALAEARQAIEAGDSILAAQWVRQARSLPGYENKPEGLRLWSRLYTLLAHRTLKGGWEEQALEGHKDGVTAAHLTPDGRFALSARRDHTIRLWRVDSARCLRTIRVQDTFVQAANLTDDGQRFLSADGNGALTLWDAQTGEVLWTQMAHEGGANAVDLSPDALWAISGGSDGLVKLWQTETGRCVRTLKKHIDAVATVAFHKGGRYALSGGLDHYLYLWDLAKGQPIISLHGHTGSVRTACLSADGRQALSGEAHPEGFGTLKLWDLATARCVRSFEGHNGGIHAVRLSLDGRFAFSGGGDGAVKVWSIANGRCLRTFEGHARAVKALGLSADGRTLISGGEDKALKLWFLDWELEKNEPAAWDDGAKAYLTMFLTQRTPRRATLARLWKPLPITVSRALMRRGTPKWAQEDFEDLMETLRRAGFGWLSPEGVRRELERRAKGWREPPGFADLRD